MDSEILPINNTPNPSDSLEVAIKGLSMRSKAIAGNIANANTPQYKRREVNFEETLKKVQGDPKLTDIPMKKTNEKHFGNEIFSVNQAMSSLEMKSEENDSFINGNNVDLEREMIELTKTGMRFKAITNLEKKQYDGLRSVMRGG